MIINMRVEFSSTLWILLHTRQRDVINQSSKKIFCYVCAANKSSRACARIILGHALGATNPLQKFTVCWLYDLSSDQYQRSWPRQGRTGSCRAYTWPRVQFYTHISLLANILDSIISSNLLRSSNYVAMSSAPDSCEKLTFFKTL